MRVLVAMFASIAILVSGCGILEKERTNRGGYLDYLVDKYWIKADSKGMRALRAFAIQVSLARIASVSEKNEIDRQLLALRIGTLTKRFRPIYACAFNTNPLGVRGAETDPCFYYDSAMVDYSTGLFDLAMVALPVDDAKKLMNAATGSVVNPINLLDLLDSLLAIGRDAIRYGRIVGALYRDTVELEVQVWLGTPLIDDRPPPFRVTETDVAPLRAIYAGRHDDLPAWLAAIAALRGQGLEPVPQAKFFAELAGLMKHICSLITQEPLSLRRCQEGLPTTVPPVKPVLSAGPVMIGGPVHQPVIGGGSGVGGSSGGPGGGVQQTRLPPDDKDVPTSIPPAQMKTIQANLCVEKLTGRLDGATTKAIRQAKLAVRESQQASDALRFDNADGKMSDVEAQIFLDQRNCSKDSTGVERGYLTAFEKFRFRNGGAITGLRRLLSACERSLTPQNSEAFDEAIRGAIKAIKDKAPEADRAKFAAPSSNTLDDQAYAYIRKTCI
jgi:hypothetical protein